MQTVAGVVERLFHAAAIEHLKVFAESLADLAGRGSLLSGGQVVVLGDVVAFQPLEGFHRVAQTGRGHAPCANGRADQVHRLIAAWQPLAKQETVDRSEDQAFGATRCCGDDADVMGTQAVLFNVPPGRGAGVETERLHKAAIVAQPDGSKHQCGSDASVTSE